MPLLSLKELGVCVCDKQEKLLVLHRVIVTILSTEKKLYNTRISVTLISIF